MLNLPRILIAYHEAGHAVVSVAYSRRLDYVTIRPGDDYLGRCQSTDPENRQVFAWMRTDLAFYRMPILWDVRWMLAGLAAERVFTGKDPDVWEDFLTCPSETLVRYHDLDHARDWLRSAYPRSRQDSRVRLRRHYRWAVDFLRVNGGALTLLASELVARETLDGAAVERLLRGRIVTSGLHRGLPRGLSRNPNCPLSSTGHVEKPPTKMLAGAS